MSKEIQGGRWETMLRRLFSLRGNTSLVMVEDVQPVMPVEEWQASFDALLGKRRRMASASVGALAGNFSGVSLFNPADSQTLVEVEQLLVSGAQPSNSDLSWGASWGTGNTRVVGTTQATGNLDMRLGTDQTAGSGVAQFSAGNRVGMNTPYLLHAYAHSLHGLYQLRVPIIMPPDTSLELLTFTQNIDFMGGIIWTERPIAAPEDL